MAGDELLLTQLAECADERAALRDLIAEGGRVARGSQGQPVTAPPVEQLRALENQMLKLMDRLGIGPSARARLGVAISTAARNTVTTAAREAAVAALARDR